VVAGGTVKRSTKTKILFLVTVVVIFFTGFVAGVHYLWDTDRQTRLLQRKIETFLQRPVHIYKARLSLFPRIQVVLEKVAIKERGRSADIMFFEKLRMGVALGPLLHGTFHCTFVRVEQPRITIIRTPDQRFNISDVLDNIAKTSAIAEPAKGSWFRGFRFRLGKVAVRNGALTFIDQGACDPPRTFRFFDLDLQTGTIAASGLTPVSFIGRLAKSPGKSESALINLQGKIGPLLESPNAGLIRFTGDLGVKDLDIASFSPYLKGTEKIGAPEGTVSGTGSFSGSFKGTIHVSAKLEIDNLAMDHQEVSGKPFKVSKAGLSFSLTRDSQGVTLPDIHLALPEFEADGKLMITKAEPPLIDAEVRIKHCQYQHLLPYLPCALFSKPAQEAMAQHIVAGSIDRLLLRYSETGSEKVLNRPGGKIEFLSGNMRFHDFSIRFFDDIPLATGLNGELRLKNRNLTLANLTGRFGNSEIRKGTMSLSKLSFLDTSLDLKLDLAEVLTLLHDRRIPESASERLQRIRHLDGTALLKLDASGPLDDLRALAFGGTMELLGVNLDYEHFRKIGSDLTGTIHFTPYVIKSDELRGWWAHSPVTAWFKIENYLSPPKALLTAHVASNESDINDVASAFFPWEGVYGEGLLDIQVDFACPGFRTQDLYFEGTGTFADVMLTFPDFPHPFTHIGGTVDFSYRGLRFSGIRAETGSSTFSYSGSWDNLLNPVISGEVLGAAVDLLDFYAPPLPEGKKRTEHYTVDNLSVTLEEVRCNDLFFNDLKSVVSFDTGTVTFTSLKAAKGKFRGFDFVNLTNIREGRPVEMRYRDRVASIPYVALESQHGTWVGTDITVPLWSDHEERFSLTTAIEDISVEELLQCFAADKQRLTGTLNLTGTISGLGKKLLEPIKTWEGEFTVTVKNGVLKKHSVIAKVLSLLNVARIFKQDYSDLLDQGIHFNAIQGAFQVEQGIAKTDNFYFDSPAIKMDAVGDINLEQKTYDMEIAIAPLETVDKVVGKIPVLGTVLMGDEGAVVVTYYKLTGSFDNPELKQVVFTALGRKAQGIFQRIFRLPLTILKHNNKSPD